MKIGQDRIGRGRKEGVIVTRFLVVVLLLCASPAAASDFNLDSLLLESIGGPDGLRTLRESNTWVAHARVTMGGMRGIMETSIEFPDRYIAITRLPIGTITQAIDGPIVWETDMNGRTKLLEKAGRQTVLDALYFGTFGYADPERRIGEVVYLGRETVDSIEAHKVAVIVRPEDTALFYFDQTTAECFRHDRLLDHQRAMLRMGDYRSFDGLLLPMNESIELVGAGVVVQGVTDSVRMGVRLEPELFHFPSGGPDDFSFPADKSSVAVPMEYVDGHILVSAVVNGSRNIRLILDSGASTNIYNAPVVSDLELVALGQFPSMGVGGLESVDLVQVDSIRIGDLTLYDQIGARLDLGMLGRSFGQDSAIGGLLGYDFLSRVPILIDFRGRQLTLYNPDTFVADSGGQSLPFYLTLNVPTVTASINGLPGEFIVDLGNSLGLVVHKAFADRNSLADSLRNIAPADRTIAGVGGKVRALSAQAERFSIGGIEVGRVDLLLPEESRGLTGSNKLAGNIGNPILERYRLLLDYKNSQLVFYPY